MRARQVLINIGTESDAGPPEEFAMGSITALKQKLKDALSRCGDGTEREREREREKSIRVLEARGAYGALICMYIFGRGYCVLMVQQQLDYSTWR